MALTFADFLAQAMAQPILFVILVLIIGVTAVSGATDAPNAIATVVSQCANVLLMLLMASRCHPVPKAGDGGAARPDGGGRDGRDRPHGGPDLGEPECDGGERPGALGALRAGCPALRRGLPAVLRRERWN